MELCSNGLKTSSKPQIILLVILICSEMSVKSLGRVGVCGKTNKVKSNCDNNSLAFLWTIKRRTGPAVLPILSPNSPISYFFGTIHVPYSRVWDSIPSRVKLAFQTSDSIFFELDLMDAYTVSTLANCQMLPKGVKLIDILPSDLYNRLKRHLDYVRLMLPTWVTPDQKARGLYAEYLYNAITGNWERKRPVWVMLMVNSLNQHDIKSRGIPVLDLFLAQEAQRLNKKIGSVEKVEEQCIPLNGLNFSQVLFALNQTLYQHEGIRRGDLKSKVTTDQLIRHYNCGNLNKIIFNYDTTHFLNLKNTSFTANSDEMHFSKQIENYFRSELIIKRNKRMSQRVLNILEDNPNQSFFFAFGAGHFLGNNSILDFIEGNGFEVSRVSDVTNNKGYKYRCRHHHNKQSAQNKLQSESIFSEHLVSQKSSTNIRLNNEKRVNSKDFNLIFSSNRNINDSIDSNDNNNNNNKKRKNRFVVSTNDRQNGETTQSMPLSILTSVKNSALKWQTSDAFNNGYIHTLITTSSSGQPNRRFNDLWMRLETVPTESSILIPRQQLTKDVQIMTDNLQVWRSSATSDGSTPFNLFCCYSSVNSILVSYIYTTILLISRFNSLIL